MNEDATQPKKKARGRPSKTGLEAQWDDTAVDQLF